MKTHVLSHYIFHPTTYTLEVGSNIVNSHPTWFRKHKIVLWLGIRCVCEFFNTHCGVEKSTLYPPLDKNCACDIYGIISFYWIYKSSKTTKTRSGIFFPRFFTDNSTRDLILTTCECHIYNKIRDYTLLECKLCLF